MMRHFRGECCLKKLDDYEVILYVEDKKFGKPWITYRATLIRSKEVIREGRCKDFITTRHLYLQLMNEFGKDKVLLLQR